MVQPIGDRLSGFAPGDEVLGWTGQRASLSRVPLAGVFPLDRVREA